MMRLAVNKINCARLYETWKGTMLCEYSCGLMTVGPESAVLGGCKDIISNRLSLARYYVDDTTVRVYDD